MLYLSVILFLIGVALLCAEINIPGFGICGISGIAAIVISAFIMILSVPFYGTFIVIGELAALGAGSYLIINYMKKHQLQNKLILEETLNEDKDDISGLDALIGKSGITKTPLRPFGAAVFSGFDIEVCSNGGYIDEGASVKVVSAKGRKVFVEKQNAAVN